MDLSKIRNDGQARESGEGFNLDKLLNTEIELFGRGLNDRVKERFFDQLAALLDAGINLVSSLELIQTQSKTKKEKECFQQLIDLIMTGEQLHESMERTEVFTRFECISVQVGEESGRLEAVLRSLSTYFRERIKLRQKLYNAISYPIIVVITAIGAIVFLLNFIVPLFEDVFNRFGGELPIVTRMVVSASGLVSNHAWLLVVVFFTVSSLYIALRRKTWFRSFSARLLLLLPFGNLVLKGQLNRFSSTLALLVNSDVPMLKSLDLLSDMLTFLPMQRAMIQAREGIMSGENLNTVLGRSPLFDKRLIAMIKVGEETTQLGRMMERASEQYSREIEYQTSLLSSLLEPILILVLGVLIGFILIAIYLPVFQLSTNLL